ncbi:hypothetical protein EON64_20765 [archaeon]|nr:MAG: hypothetical protein EON64_20765 [archaeon]
MKSYYEARLSSLQAEVSLKESEREQLKAQIEIVSLTQDTQLTSELKKELQQKDMDLHKLKKQQDNLKLLSNIENKYMSQVLCMVYGIRCMLYGVWCMV